jgi:Pyruvate/2-oxoacid:ferredoxin oxidoreductase gamma subunit
VRPGGLVVYDRSVVAAPPALDPSVRVIGAECTATAVALGHPLIKNVVALGALESALGLFPVDTYFTVLRQVVKDKPALLAANEAAFAWGVRGERPTPYEAAGGAH